MTRRSFLTSAAKLVGLTLVAPALAEKVLAAPGALPVTPGRTYAEFYQKSPNSIIQDIDKVLEKMGQGDGETVMYCSSSFKQRVEQEISVLSGGA